MLMTTLIFVIVACLRTPDVLRAYILARATMQQNFTSAGSMALCQICSHNSCKISFVYFHANANIMASNIGR